MNRREYLLLCAQEECMEIAHRISKALRFGMNEVWQEKSNRDLVIEELTDLMGTLKLLHDEGILNVDSIGAEDGIQKKIAKIEEYFKYAKECGTIVEE